METGRREGLSAEERKCQCCNNDEVEDEEHFMMRCPLYERIREKLRAEVEQGEGRTLEEGTQGLQRLLGEEASEVAREGVRVFVHEALRLRNTKLLANIDN